MPFSIGVVVVVGAIRHPVLPAWAFCEAAPTPMAEMTATASPAAERARRGFQDVPEVVCLRMVPAFERWTYLVTESVRPGCESVNITLCSFSKLDSLDPLTLSESSFVQRDSSPARTSPVSARSPADVLESVGNAARTSNLDWAFSGNRLTHNPTIKMWRADGIRRKDRMPWAVCPIASDSQFFALTGPDPGTIKGKPRKVAVRPLIWNVAAWAIAE